MNMRRFALLITLVALLLALPLAACSGNDLSGAPSKVGNALSGPCYHEPPTDTFGRGDQLNGSVITETATPPKYEGLPPNPNAASGQNQGTGGGNAVTNRTGGAPVSGQAQGTGAGAAASQKGGFRSGSNSFDKGVSAPSGGSSGSGQNAGPSRSQPKPKAPSGSRGGGRSGGR